MSTIHDTHRVSAVGFPDTQRGMIWGEIPGGCPILCCSGFMETKADSCLSVLFSYLHYLFPGEGGSEGLSEIIL